jgi:hypothetical protein
MGLPREIPESHKNKDESKMKIGTDDGGDGSDKRETRLRG